jgi:hypothetical protein
MIDLLGVDQTAEIKQRGEANTWRIFETQSVAEFGIQHPLGYCDLRPVGSLTIRIVDSILRKWRTTSTSTLYKGWQR